MTLSIVKLNATGWFLDAANKVHWDMFKNPRERQTFEPWACKRTLWSVTRTYDEDGVYRGSAIIRGYEIIPESMKDMRSDGDYKYTS